MKKFLSVSFGFFVVLLVSNIFIRFSAVYAQTKNDHIPRQILVKFKSATPKNVIDAELRRHNAREISEITALGVHVLLVPGQAEERVVNALLRNPNIEFAELDFIAEALLIPNDPLFAANQWGFENTGQTIQGQIGVSDADIDAPTAWNVTLGDTIRVAILDTGIDQDHIDLASKIVKNQNFTDSQTIDDFYGHGTHVAGIVGAVTDNGIGIAGGCPACLLMNVKVLNDSGSGAYSWIANGIIFAADNSAKVINMSLGGPVKSYTLEKAVNYAWNKGVVVVAAAGNSGNRSKTYPGAYSRVIAVAATDNKDKKASFSSYGSWVDVTAPGVAIYSTFPNHQYSINKSLNYDFGSGTSMATPMVSATAGLVWATLYGTSASSVRQRVESTADKIAGTGNYWIYGRVNASHAVGL